MVTPTPGRAVKQREHAQAAQAARNARARNRDTRFQARMSTRQREILEEAAIIEGRTLTDFVLVHAQQAAQRAIKEHRLLQLSERDAQVFFHALDTPWEPSAALREDVRRMQELLDGE
jgi:uncharacterized protein (DUF1778 family)